MKAKKASDMSINLIVVAVIALVVLVILILILSGRMNIFSRGLKDCNSLGGQCITKQACNEYAESRIIIGTNCDLKNTANKKPPMFVEGYANGDTVCCMAVEEKYDTSP
jgi:hypothetical protein